MQVSRRICIEQYTRASGATAISCRQQNYSSTKLNVKPLTLHYAYTLSALIDLPMTTAIHSPAGVECPVFIVIGAICGDQARFVISLCAEYAMMGSVITRLFPSDGLGELSRELALRGDAAGAGA